MLLFLSFDVGDRVAYGGDFFSVFVRDRNLEFFFELHDQLDGVERIGAEVIGKACCRHYFSCIHTKFIYDNLGYF